MTRRPDAEPVADPPPASAVAVGTVRHRRHHPRRYAFTHGLYHVLLDLDELDRLDREVTGFGVNRAAVTSFHDRDHLGDADLPVRTKLERWLAAQGRALPGGKVLLHTNLRVLGYVFNPVSWFYCYDRDGRLQVVVAEVNNTFGETYCYLLDDLDHSSPHRVRARRRKVFHVSPFLPVDGLGYEFTLRPPGDVVAVHMDVRDGEGRRVLDATVGERLRPLDTRNLLGALARYPLVTLRTIALIHRHALSLWWRRLVFHRKPPPPDNGLDLDTSHPLDTSSDPTDLQEQAS